MTSSSRSANASPQQGLDKACCTSPIIQGERHSRADVVFEGRHSSDVAEGQQQEPCYLRYPDEYITPLREHPEQLADIKPTIKTYAVLNISYKHTKLSRNTNQKQWHWDEDLAVPRPPRQLHANHLSSHAWAVRRVLGAPRVLVAPPG
ncbi:MAG: hypothetical protein M1840_008418 [Geoglossum simile]|nr:MAG: hypothetical protein M1840_008418 [Geoglossum simile]